MSIDLIEKIKLRRSVRFLYEIQKLRISTAQRGDKRIRGGEAILIPEEEMKFFMEAAGRLEQLECDTEKEVKKVLKGIPIWENWLKRQKGIGPRLGGVIISEFDITKCNTISAMWSYAGLAVVDGKAAHFKRGEKGGYNPWLKAKILKVLGDSFMKSNSPWRKFYDDYKHRKQNQLVNVCMACSGKGKVKYKKNKFGEEELIGGVSAKEESVKTDERKRNRYSSILSRSTFKVVVGEESGRIAICANCKGTGGPTCWGKSDKHRHNAAIRYMAKQFLSALWLEWRNMENLPIRVPYAEEYLNRKHHE